MKEGTMTETLGQLFLNTVKSYPKDDLMLYKKEGQYTPISTAEFGDRVKYLSLGLRDLGFEAGDKLIILSDNRPEWVITDFACLCLGGITVPIYTSLVSEQIKYIIDNSDAKIVVVSDPTLWENVEPLRGELTKVAHYITFADEPPQGVLRFAEVIERGQRIDKENPEIFERTIHSVRPDDVASIIYTSGTTGIPKGVMLTHANFVSNVKAAAEILFFSDKDYVLSWLPLSHVLERMVTFTYLFKGCSIGYAESIETVPDNLLEIKPHIMVSVPRFFEKVYSKVMDNVLSSSGLKKKIFFWAVKTGREVSRKKLLNQPVTGFLKFKHNLAHKLVFAKIIEKTGGRTRFFVSGGAPLSQDIAEFFHAMGLVVLEGYGLTETSPLISVNTFENMRFGSVGKPAPKIEVKIAEDGEILAKGPNIMKGYYKMEEETKDAFDEGWFCTGDIGHIDQDGFLVITDRKKDLIVTAGGKNVAPQPIENQLKTNPYITNAVVIGDKKKFICALVVPEFEKLEEYAKFNDIPFEDRSRLVNDERVMNFMQSEVERSTPSLSSYEKIKKIALLDRDFEIDRGEITPTLKVKRNIIEDKYEGIIQSLYREE
jgi:long-chain acyl-CoA synthetase